jgi:hypothetical protein
MGYKGLTCYIPARQAMEPNKCSKWEWIPWKDVRKWVKGQTETEAGKGSILILIQLQCMVSLECDKRRINLEPSSSYFRSDDYANQTLLELRNTHIICHYNCLSSVRECLQLDTNYSCPFPINCKASSYSPSLPGQRWLEFPVQQNPRYYYCRLPFYCNRHL